MFEPVSCADHRARRRANYERRANRRSDQAVGSPVASHRFAKRSRLAQRRDGGRAHDRGGRGGASHRHTYQRRGDG